MYLFRLTLSFSCLFLLGGILFDFFFGKNTEHMTTEVVLEKIKKALFSKWNDKEVVLLKSAWKQVIIKKIPERSFFALVEVPLLLIISFYTLIRTRFSVLELMLFYRAALLVLFQQSFVIYLYYCGPMLVLTGLISIPYVQKHFKKVYSPGLLKDLGWNTFWKTIISQIGSGAKTSLALGGTWLGNEVISPLVGAWRAEDYADSVSSASVRTEKQNVVLIRNGQKAQELPILDPQVYISIRRNTNVLKEIVSTVTPALVEISNAYSESDKLPPTKEKID